MKSLILGQEQEVIERQQIPVQIVSSEISQNLAIINFPTQRHQNVFDRPKITVFKSQGRKDIEKQKTIQHKDKKSSDFSFELEFGNHRNKKFFFDIPLLMRNRAKNNQKQQNRSKSTNIQLKDYYRIGQTGKKQTVHIILEYGINRALLSFPDIYKQAKMIIKGGRAEQKILNETINEQKKKSRKKSNLKNMDLSTSSI